MGGDGGVIAASRVNRGGKMRNGAERTRTCDTTENLPQSDRRGVKHLGGFL